MHVETFSTAVAFLEAAQSALEANDLVNSLPLGIALRLKSGSLIPTQAPFLGIVRADDGAVLAAGLMTPPYNLLIAEIGAESDAAALALLGQALREGGWPVPGVNGPRPRADRFAAQWTADTGQPHQVVTNLRLYRLTAVRAFGEAGGRLRPATEADIPLLAVWSEAFHLEATPHSPSPDAVEATRQRVAAGELYIWEDGGRAVSCAASSRPTRSAITVSLVYTPPAQRRRGYATSCVAALSQRLLDQGYPCCVLFTNLANPTSNHIYQEIGYEPICDFVGYKFETGA